MQLTPTFTDAYDALPTPVSAIGADGSILYANPAFRTLFRLPEQFDTSIYALTPSVHHRDIEAAIALLDSGEADDLELEGTCLTHDNEEFWGRLHASAVRFSDGSPPCFLGVVLDHTEAQRRHRELIERHEEALEVARAKSSFVASVSHELRSPLHTILGLSELLCSGDLAPEEERLAAAIHQEGEALRGVIDDILDFSKAEAGRITLVESRFSPAQLVDETTDTLRRAAEEKQLVLTAEIGVNCPPAVTGDRNRVRQILVNLLTNAIKYTESGSITVAVDHADDQLHLVVSDTGIGIPANRLNDLFEPFAQVQGEHQQRGTGLGLAITDKLVGLMDGSITVESTLGQGSRFSVTLPLDAMHRPGTLQRIDRAAIRPDGMRILVVEDVPINQMLTAGQLDRLGYRSTIAASGAEALRELAESSHDLVLMDWHMPGMDGLETTRRYRSEEQAGTRLPIIAMTASAMQGDREECLAAGMDDFLAKPVLIDDLESMLSKWLAATPSIGEHTQALPVVEGDTLSQLQAEFGDSSVLVKVVETFVDDLEQRATAIPDAADDLRALHREAHTLKSTSAMLGARQLASICEQIERSATPDAVASDRDELFAQLAVSIEQTKTEMTNALQRL